MRKLSREHGDAEMKVTAGSLSQQPSGSEPLALKRLR